MLTYPKSACINGICGVFGFMNVYLIMIVFWEDFNKIWNSDFLRAYTVYITILVIMIGSKPVTICWHSDLNWKGIP